MRAYFDRTRPTIIWTPVHGEYIRFYSIFWDDERPEAPCARLDWWRHCAPTGMPLGWGSDTDGDQELNSTTKLAAGS